jgi:Cd2+/Zn2+-exporting ATPase
VSQGARSDGSDSHEDGDTDTERWQRIGALACGGLAAAAWAVTLLDVPALWPIALYAFSVAVGAWPLLRGAWRALGARSLDMNVLMSIAVLGACILGDWGEAAALVFLYAISEWLEEASVHRSRSAITGLMKLAPPRALVRRESLSASTQNTAADSQSENDLIEIDAGEVQVGQVFVVRSGERIALDGVIVAGHSDVDQAPVTGESLPVEKAAGDEVFAGTLNGTGVLDVRAVRPAHEGTTARIARLVMEAQGQKSKRQRTVEKFALRYTPIVLVVATLVALVPPLAFRAPWNDSILRALALLVAACPCAFVLSGPVASICALSHAARQGILVRGGAALESLAQVRAIAFDKTGTLTQGLPAVRDFITLNGIEPQQALAIAASLEAQSEHPLARAVVAYARGRNADILAVGEAQELGGRGLSGIVCGRRYQIGRAELFEGRGSSANDAISSLRNSGRSIAVLGDEHGPTAAFGFCDSIRPEAQRVLEHLKEQGIETRVILSGDNEAAVRDVASEVGADEWRAELLPQDKLDAVRALSLQYDRVAMVGDGINDAPALALADIGVAMGVAGTDAAIEAADVALMSDDLQKMPQAITIARHARAVIIQNVGIALAMKAIFVVGLFLNMWGEYQLIGGVIADTGATLLVTANALRLLRG